MGQIALLIKTSRVPGWCFGPILYTIGVIHSSFPPKTVTSLLVSSFQIICLSFPLCIIVFGVNDVYDYASDIHNPRKRAQSLEGSVLSPSDHAFVLASARVSSILIIISFLPSIFSLDLHGLALDIDIQTLFLVFLLLLLSWGYSAPPLRLKARPILDSLTNGLIVWLVWACGYSARGGSFFGHNRNGKETKGWILALLTSGIHALGAGADIDSDAAAGQMTIAVALGRRFTAAIAASCFLLASLIVDTHSLVGAYMSVGCLVTFVPVFKPTWMHAIFQAIVWMSIVCVSAWIALRFWAMTL